MKKNINLLFLLSMIVANAIAGQENIIRSPRIEQSRAVSRLLTLLKDNAAACDAVLCIQAEKVPSREDTHYALQALVQLKSQNPSVEITKKVVEKAFLRASLDELCGAE
jgi:hypothetical protein